MKKFTKDALQEKAERLMKAHKADTIFGTEDGEIFLKEHEAKGHVRDIGGAPGETLKVYTYGKVEVVREGTNQGAKQATKGSVELHDDPEKVKAAEAEKAKAAENAKVPGAGEGKAAKALEVVREDTNQGADQSEAGPLAD